jgi:hypothetical protein
LKQDKIIEPNPEDYISVTTNYDYRLPTEEETNKLTKFIDSIFPKTDVKNHYCECLATGLQGVQMEKLFIATGCWW